MHEKKPSDPPPAGTHTSDDDTGPDATRVRIVQPAEEIPVFNCLVYVRRVGQEFAARVANLDDPRLESKSPSQRSALQQVVAEFKKLMMANRDAGDEVKLLDTPPPPDATETALYVPVHL